MGLILWIDQNTFATTLLEKVFKKKDLSFYSLSSVEDFSYLVEDLRPELIVLDAKTVMTHLSEFYRQVEASEILKATSMVLIDEEEELMKLKNVIGKIHRPFDPFNIPEMLQNILKSH